MEATESSKRYIDESLHIDTRLDRIELCLARDYVPRSEFAQSQAKLEEHMVRIEEKLDRMLERQR